MNNKIDLIFASCLDQKVDAVVNAANKYLICGLGVCGAIFNKAGIKELTEACNNINTPLKDGEAVITPSFKMYNAKYIIHAVGPDFNITPNAFDKLFDAYYNSLILLKDNNLHSIAFPLISSGIFGGNLDNPPLISAKYCLNAYNKFIKEYNYDIDVKLCAYTEKEYNSIKNLFVS